MTKVKQGDSVAVHYTGTLADGTVFDSSEGRDPLTFTVGSGQVIEGFENAVVGMAEGESKTVTIASQDAYGPHDPAMVRRIGRETVPPEIALREGMQLSARNQEGQTVAVVVTELDDDSVTLDANHPLAGKDLVFTISLVGIG